MYQKNSYEFPFKVCVNFVDSYPKKTILWKRAVSLSLLPASGPAAGFPDSPNRGQRLKGT